MATGSVRTRPSKGEKIMSSSSKKFGLEALLTPETSVLVLIDHQPFQFANLHSHEPTMVVNNVLGLAKAAKGFKVPTILQRMIQAGATPLTWIGGMREWQRDWGRAATIP